MYDISEALDENEDIIVKQIYEKKENIENHYDSFDNIYIVKRDPRDICVSKIMYLAKGLNELPIDILENIISKNKPIIKYTAYKFVIKNYNYFEEILNYNNYKIIDYEKFVDGDFSQVMDLGEIRSFDLSGFHEKKFRIGEPGNWKKWFTEEDVEDFKNEMELNNINTKLFDWELSPERVSYEESIGYILKGSRELKLVENWPNQSDEPAKQTKSKKFRNFLSIMSKK